MRLPNIHWSWISAALWLAIAAAANGAGPATAGKASPDLPAAGTLQEARQLFKAEEYEAAAERLKAATGSDNELPPSQVILAEWFSRSARPGLARRALEKAVTDEPSDPEAYVILSDFALREGRLAESESLCFRAYTLLPSFKRSVRRRDLLRPRILANLAAVCESRGRWTEAEKYLRAWLAADPDASTAMHRLGRALLHAGQEEEALKQLRAAAKLDQNLASPEVVQGQLYEELGKHSLAVQRMESAIRAAPLDLRTRLAVGQWALETGQYAEAQKQAREAARLSPNSGEVKQLAGLVALFRHNYAEAESTFESVLKQTPDSFSARNNLAIAMAEQNDPAKRRKAIEHAEANLLRMPHSPDAYSTLGWTLFRDGRIAEAQRALRTSISNGADSPDTAYFLARISLDQGDKLEARRLLESALSSKSPCLLKTESRQLLAQLR